MSQAPTVDHRAAVWAGAAVVAALGVAVVGSGNLRWFDAALVGCPLSPLGPDGGAGTYI